MADRRKLADAIVRERAMVVATLPIEDPEPGPASRLWAMGIATVAWKATFARDDDARRDLVLLLGAHVMGWLEALDGPDDVA